ncbi:hypothetical protein Cgig2_030617 [Carnegiea gigantea]|uniref:Uncharacterized protein n=1 Tax=Carnegiea gigantea TaxID=171969 RepID=A0A9Q1QDK7_9CARY|nr:hypothetical protein Cgig2_030617 [Carnegiea gigantea]
MGEFVARHFLWDQRGIAFSPSPLPKDFQTLCPGFELAVAEQAAEYYELPELPQVIFYAMLLNEVERLRIYEARFRPKGSLRENSRAGRQEESSGRGTATFYAKLLNEAVELGVAHEYTAESMKSSLLYRLADEVEVRGSVDSQDEGLGSVSPPVPSSDEE